MKWTVSNVTQIDIELPWIIDDKPTGGRSSQQQQRKEKLELTIVAIGGLADWPTGATISTAFMWHTEDKDTEIERKTI